MSKVLTLKTRDDVDAHEHIAGHAYYDWDDAAPGGGADAGVEFKAGDSDHLSGTIAHSSVDIDGLDSRTMTLDDGVTDGFRKTILGTGNSGGATRVEGALRMFASSSEASSTGTHVVAMNFRHPRDSVSLLWVAALSAWQIMEIHGTDLIFENATEINERETVYAGGTGLSATGVTNAHGITTVTFRNKHATGAADALNVLAAGDGQIIGQGSLTFNAHNPDVGPDDGNGSSLSLSNNGNADLSSSGTGDLYLRSPNARLVKLQSNPAGLLEAFSSGGGSAQVPSPDWSGFTADQKAQALLNILIGFGFVAAPS